MIFLGFTLQNAINVHELVVVVNCYCADMLLLGIFGGILDIIYLYMSHSLTSHTEYYLVLRLW